MLDDERPICGAAMSATLLTMTPEISARTWQDLCSSQRTFRDLGGLSHRDGLQVALLGKTAMDVGRFEQAAHIFEFAYQLASDQPEYLLYKTYAEAEFDRARAATTLKRYLSNQPLPNEDVVRALLLDARLHHQEDPARAKASFKAAKKLSTKTPASGAAFKEMGQ